MSKRIHPEEQIRGSGTEEHNNQLKPLSGSKAGGTPAEVNQVFNEELEKYDSFDDGHIFRLGMPCQLLQNYGIPAQPIELSRRVIEIKSKTENHPFEVQSLRNLPNALRHPIAIFQYSDNSKRNIITDLISDHKYFLVGIQKLHIQRNRSQ